MIAMDRNGERDALRLAVRDQFTERRRIEHCPGQRVRTGLARLLEHGDRQRFAAVCLLQLRETKRGREAGGATADDQDIDFESLAPFVGSLRQRRDAVEMST